MTSRVRILCVDDEPYVLKSLRRLFIQTEFDPVFANSGQEALALIADEEFAAVITDYRMPGMNGVELLGHVFQRTAKTARLVLSGYADVSTVLEAVNNGRVDKFIPKPWDDDKLLQMLREGVERFRLAEKEQQKKVKLHKHSLQLVHHNLQLRSVLDAKQAALKASESRLREAQQIAGLGDWEWSCATDELSWSENMFAIHGITTILPDMSAYLQSLPDKEQYRCRILLQEALAGPEEFNFEHLISLPDGELRQMLVRGRLWHDEEGGVIGLRGTSQDVTEQKMVEAELQRLNAELEERVRVRTMELERVVKELDAFTAAVSHDLRAPLRHLYGYAECLLEELGNNAPANLLNIAERIHERSNTASELVSSLLELSQLNRLPLQKEPIDLTLLAKQVVEEIEPIYTGSLADWQIADGLQGDGDLKLMRILLTNLLGNARKYAANVASPVISFACRQDAEETVYFVRDNGAGFDMTYVGKLFQPFQRLHSQEEFRGHGIGLTTAERIVRRHGGRIWAEGEAGHGATFSFTLR